MFDALLLHFRALYKIDMLVWCGEGRVDGWYFGFIALVEVRVGEHTAGI